MNAFELTGVERGDDVWMDELRCRLDLTIEPLHETRVVRRGLGKKLQRHLTLHHTVHGCIYRTHASGADAVEYDIVADPQPLRRSAEYRADLKI